MRRSQMKKMSILAMFLVVALFAAGCRAGAEDSLPSDSLVGYDQVEKQSGENGQDEQQGSAPAGKDLSDHGALAKILVSEGSSRLSGSQSSRIGNLSQAPDNSSDLQLAGQDIFTDGLDDPGDDDIDDPDDDDLDDCDDDETDIDDDSDDSDDSDDGGDDDVDCDDDENGDGDDSGDDGDSGDDDSDHLNDGGSDDDDDHGENGGHHSDDDSDDDHNHGGDDSDHDDDD